MCIKLLKVSYFQNEIMKSSFLPKYERKTVRISALSCVVRAEIMTIFCSHFGRHDDFIIHSEINWPLGCGNYSREETIHGYTVSSYLCMERQIVYTELGLFRIVDAAAQICYFFMTSWRSRNIHMMSLYWCMTYHSEKNLTQKYNRQDPFYNTIILFFSFTWAGLAAFHKPNPI